MSEQQKHTPGPWYRAAHASLTIRCDSGIHADVPVATVSALTPHTEADARLIAAAPDMLDALRAAVFSFDVDDAWTGNGTIEAAVDACLLAIAKATGK
jgi:hypothetical protein